MFLQHDPEFREQLQQVVDDLWGGWKPYDKRPPAEIAAEHLYLSSRYSALPGLVDFGSHPWLVEPLNCMHPEDPTHTIVVQGPVQAGKTIILQAALTYIITTVPGPTLFVTDTDEKAELFSMIRLETMIAASPILRELIALSGSKYNLKQSKSFKGGRIDVVGAQSGSKLTSQSYRYGLVDEVDDHNADLSGAGSSVALVRGRLTTYQDVSKMVLVSSPKVQEQSTITEWRERGDDCRFVLPCPFCGEFQPLVFREQIEATSDYRYRLVWDPGDPTSVRYICKFCEKEIEENHKVAMLPAGRWQATRSPAVEGVRSFWFNALYLPLGSYSWTSLVQQWEAAVALSRKGNQDELKTFINTRLAEPFKEVGITINSHTLASRIEPSWGVTIPEGVNTVVCGVDVQEDRLEIMTLGIGADWEVWILDYDIIDASPVLNDTWAELLKKIRRLWHTQDGRTLKAVTTCVDAGYLQQQVLNFTSQFERERIFGTRGLARSGPIFPKKASKTKKRQTFYAVSTISGKDSVFNLLSVNMPGPMYCHIPDHVLDKCPTLLQQLTSEERLKDKKGKVTWQKRTERVRNEALDTFVLCLAAAHSLLLEGLNFIKERPKKKSAKKSLTPAPRSVIVPAKGSKRADVYRGGRVW